MASFDPVDYDPFTAFTPSAVPVTQQPPAAMHVAPVAQTTPAATSGSFTPVDHDPFGDPGLLESFARGAAEGATFGFDDKLGLSKERREASKAANPWTHFFGEVTGGLAPMAAATLLPGGQPLAAGRAAGLSARAVGLARAALVPGEIGTAGQAMAQGAKLGATYGSLSGAGHADVDPEDTMGEAARKRVVGGLEGGAVGAVTGPLFGLVGHGVYRGGQALGGLRAAAQAETDDAGRGALTTISKNLERDRVSPQDLIDQIRAEFPDDTAAAIKAGNNRRYWGNATSGQRQPITADHVEETVRRAMMGETAQEISQALSAGGNGPGPTAVQSLLNELAERHLGPLNIVDRASMVRLGSGDNTQMTMRAAAATPGEHVGAAREALLGRQVGSGGRLSDMFDRIVGSSDYDGVAATHASKLEDAGSRAYTSAFANEKPFDLQPVINKWMAQYDGKRGPIPEAVSSAIDSIQTKVPIRNQVTGAIVDYQLKPPSTLQEFIDARQNMLSEAMKRSPGVTKAQMVSGNSDLITPESSRIMGLRGELSATVRNTNPSWGVANDVWRDGMAASNSLESGAKMTTRLNSGSRESMSDFTDAQTRASKATKDLTAANSSIRVANKNSAPITPNMQSEVDSAQARLDAANSRMELFKVGLVRSLNDTIANKGETDNITKQLLLPGSRQTLTKILGQDTADQFFNTVRAEAAMKRTYASQFGSQTTPLKEAVEDLNWAPRFEASWSNLGLGKVLQLAQDYAARNINATRNKQLMGLYTETDPLKQLDILRSAQNVHAARVNAGNTLGMPVVSSAGPMLDAALGDQSNSYQHDPMRQSIITSRPPRTNGGN